MVISLVYFVGEDCLRDKSCRKDIRATTIPLLEDLNHHDLIHTLEFEGAWPCHLVCLSWRAQYILDMVLDTDLGKTKEVVAMLD